MPCDKRFSTRWPCLGTVGAVQIVEGAVLADDHDHVLDRRHRVMVVMLSLIGPGDGAASDLPADQGGQREHSDPFPQRSVHGPPSMAPDG
jgi:hypothetical protein